MSEKLQTAIQAAGIDEAAEISTTSRSTIKRAIKAGDLKAFRRGRRVLIFLVDLEKWMRAGGSAR